MKKRTKRKIKKFFKKNLVFLFCVPLFVTLFLITTAYSLHTQELTVTGKGQIISAIDTPTENYCSFEVTYTDTNTSGYEANKSFDINFTNTSTKIMHTIILEFDKIGEYTGFYGPGTVVEDGDKIRLLVATYLTPIYPNETKTFQMFIENTDTTIEEWMNTFSIVGCGQNGTDTNTTIGSGDNTMILNPYEEQILGTSEYYITHSWEAVNEYKIVIENNTNHDLTGWRAYIYYGPATYEFGYNFWKLYDEPEEKRLMLYGNDTLTPGQQVVIYLGLSDIPSDDFNPTVLAAGLTI